ncbi:MAG: hypothetical protein ACK5LK_10480 [Chthoniobacterales bacterium]
MFETNLDFSSSGGVVLAVGSYGYRRLSRLAGPTRSLRLVYLKHFFFWYYRFFQKLNRAALFLALSFLGVLGLHAGEGALPPALPILYPKFMNPKITTLVSESERTSIALQECRGQEFDPTRLPDAMPLPIEKITPEIRAAADAYFKDTMPELVRDSNGVVLCGILDMEIPVATAAIFSPDFIDRLEPIFGTDLMVAAPRADRIYIFPALAAETGLFIKNILADFRSATQPVSQEMFRVNRNSIVALGLIDDK